MTDFPSQTPQAIELSHIIHPIGTSTWCNLPIDQVEKYNYSHSGSNCQTCLDLDAAYRNIPAKQAPKPKAYVVHLLCEKNPGRVWCGQQAKGLRIQQHNEEIVCRTCQRTRTVDALGRGKYFQS